jgi:hypothetical protein
MLPRGMLRDLQAVKLSEKDTHSEFLVELTNLNIRQLCADGIIEIHDYLRQENSTGDPNNIYILEDLEKEILKRNTALFKLKPLHHCVLGLRVPDDGELNVTHTDPSTAQEDLWKINLYYTILDNDRFEIMKNYFDDVIQEVARKDPLEVYRMV